MCITLPESSSALQKNSNMLTGILFLLFVSGPPALPSCPPPSLSACWSCENLLPSASSLPCAPGFRGLGAQGQWAMQMWLASFWLAHSIPAYHHLHANTEAIAGPPWLPSSSQSPAGVCLIGILPGMLRGSLSPIIAGLCFALLPVEGEASAGQQCWGQTQWGQIKSSALRGSQPPPCASSPR